MADETDVSIYKPRERKGIGAMSPTELLGLAQGAQKFGAEREVNDIIRGAADPSDPSGINRDALTQGLVRSTNPLVPAMAQEHIQRVIQTQAAAHEAATQQFRNMSSAVGALTSQRDISDNDLRETAIILRRLNVPQAIVQPILDAQGMPLAEKRRRLNTLGQMGQGYGAVMAPVPGTPSAAGEPTEVPAGAKIRDISGEPGTGAPAAGPGGAGAITPYRTGMAPGEAGVMEDASKRASQLQATAGVTAQYHADLDNLKQDSKVLENLSGPTVEVEKRLNQLSHRLAGVGVTMTPEELKAAEGFDKVVNQITLNQSKMFHGSDAGLLMNLGANPSLLMSSYGRDGVIDLLQGNQDAIDATRKEWLNARAKGVPAGSYDLWVNEFSKNFDPRVFQFNRMSRDNQQTFLSQMDPADIAGFEQRYQDALARKWVKPPKKKP